MNQNKSEKLFKSLFSNITILPNSDRSAYNSDEEYYEAMQKHNEIANIVESWNADK